MLVSAKAGHATVEIAGASSFGDAVSSNGIGLKRGESDEEIVVCGHIDSWFSVGAVDNGSGIASVVELAKLLCRYPLKRTVRFVSLGSEEVGLLGSQAFVATHADISRVVLVVNLDCPTLKDPRLTVFTNETPALHSFMEEIVKALHVDVELSTGMSRYSDHVSFRHRGVAGVTSSPAAPRAVSATRSTTAWTRSGPRTSRSRCSSPGPRSWSAPCATYGSRCRADRRRRPPRGPRPAAAGQKPSWAVRVMISSCSSRPRLQK